MEFTVELLEDVSASLTNQQRTLASLKQKREAHPEEAGILDSLIEKFDDMCAHLEKLKTDLRMSAVTERT